MRTVSHTLFWSACASIQICILLASYELPLSRFSYILCFSILVCSPKLGACNRSWLGSPYRPYSVAENMLLLFLFLFLFLFLLLRASGYRTVEHPYLLRHQVLVLHIHVTKRPYTYILKRHGPESHVTCFDLIS